MELVSAIITGILLGAFVLLLAGGVAWVLNKLEEM